LIRKADQDWLRVFAAKDLTKSVDFVIAGGSVLAPNAPVATGHNEISKLFAGFFALPDLKIEWRPNKVEVARSGEIGYSTGAFHMTFKDPSGKTIEDRGKYVTIWKKQRGRWMVAYDIFNSDLSSTP
jgi:ketosteroid isomerase-like protein